MQRRRWILALVALALPGGVAVAEPLRAVIQLDEPEDEELVRRIRGQTVDLDLSLVPVRAESSSPTVALQFARAHALAAAHQAQAVIWFRTDENGALVVYIADPGRDRLFERAIPQTSADPDARSAAAETAALVVRSALRALLAGSPIGAPRTRPTEKPVPRPSPSAEDPWQWRVGVGWQMAADGAAPIGRHGVAIHLALDRRRWYARVAASSTPPLVDEDDRTAIRVARHAVACALGAPLWRGPRGVLSVEMALGAVVYTRSTEVLSAEVVPTPPSRTPALAIGPALRYRRALGARGIALELFASGDAVLGAPEFGYQIAGGFVPRSSVWPVQLQLGAAVVVRAR